MSVKNYVCVWYNDTNGVYHFNSIDEIVDSENVININCEYSGLSTLPENMNFPQLEKFICSNNQITTLPKIMNFPKLKYFGCSVTQITTLPENIDKLFPLLKTLKL